jgi:hypothetical protein
MPWRCPFAEDGPDWEGLGEHGESPSPVSGNWTMDRPTVPGKFWFYGDPFWGGMNRPPEDFKPKLEIIETFQVSNGLAASCCGEFCNVNRAQGLFWSLPIPEPLAPDAIELPNARG